METPCIDEQALAQRICKREGGEKQLSIAQVKEVLRITLEEIALEVDSLEGTAALFGTLAKHAENAEKTSGDDGPQASN